MKTLEVARSTSVRRTLVTLGTLLMIGFGLPSTAAAAPPTEVPNTLPTTSFVFTDTLGNNPCGFEVKALLITNNEKLLKFVRQGGATILQVTGSLKVRLTNTKTGESIERNISGPTFQTLNPDDTIKAQKTAGPGLWALDPGVAPELPRLVITKGKTESVFNPAFRFTSRQGSYEDICSILSYNHDSRLGSDCTKRAVGEFSYCPRRSPSALLKGLSRVEDVVGKWRIRRLRARHDDLLDKRARFADECNSRRLQQSTRSPKRSARRWNPRPRRRLRRGQRCC